MGGGWSGVAQLRESIERNDTVFGTRIADNTVNRLDVPGTYNYNTDRHAFFVGGEFFRSPEEDAPDNFTDRPATYELTANPGETVEFRAREKVRYVPNYEMLWGLATWYENTPTEGQRLFAEFTDDDRGDGYRFCFEPGFTRVEQLRAGEVVDFVAETELNEELREWGEFNTARDTRDHNPLDFIDRTHPMNPRGFTGWYGALGTRFELGYARRREDANGSERGAAIPYHPVLGYTSNPEGVATDEINLNIKVVLECDAGADAFTAQACSIGALIRGNATRFDRSKSAAFWDLGGSISQYFTDNEPVLAARIDPERDNVVVELDRPNIAPAGTDFIEVLVATVQADETDADFEDPAGDGSNVGPSPSAQSRAQNDVLQYTRSVSTFPTVEDIRADGTTGQVPDTRYLAGEIGEGGGNNRATSRGSPGRRDVKKTLHADEVALFIPRTDPAGNTTDGRIRYLTPFDDQNW